MEDSAALARLIDAVRPWLPHLTFVGGWAHRLHRFHPLAWPPAYQPIRTRDADLAINLDGLVEGNIRNALALAEFEEELTGEHAPPITQYRLGSEDEGFSVEFLTPLRGSGITRSGAPDVTVAAAGVTAQKLRHLELLLIAPWAVEIGPAVGIPTAAPTSVLLPNAVSFLVQKVLIHEHRKPGKRAQDVLYIHDTLELFGPSLAELHTVWTDAVRPEMPRRTARRAGTLAADMFRDVSDVIREAALIPQDRRPSPTRIRELCQFGLSEILESR